VDREQGNFTDSLEKKDVKGDAAQNRGSKSKIPGSSTKPKEVSSPPSL